jgi:hypothetical protein
MGLLKGFGNGLKGLFAEGGPVDNMEAAQAYLDGDYGRAYALAAQYRRARQKRAAMQGKDPLAPARMELDAPEAAGMLDQPDGTIIGHPLTKQQVYRNGGWKDWMY